MFKNAKRKAIELVFLSEISISIVGTMQYSTQDNEAPN